MSPIPGPPRSSRHRPPADFVVFGGTGDLAVRKLLPALYLRDRDGQLPAETRIVALSRAGLDDAGYRDKIRGELPRLRAPPPSSTTATVDRFVARLPHVSIDIEHEAGWSDARRAAPDDPDRVRVFYLAIGPALFGPVSQRLAEHGLVTEQLAPGAREADRPRPRLGPRDQRRRRRRLRGAPDLPDRPLPRQGERPEPAGDPLRQHASSSRCGTPTASTTCRSPPPESLGVGSRGGYYDGSGALRDMVQNHLLQLLCLVAMEPPTYVGRETVRDEKLKVLQALKPIAGARRRPRRRARASTAPGLVDGQAAASYRTDAERPGSTTETFVAIKAEVQNWRWAGVPFYLRTGKRMDRRVSEIVIQFKDVPHPMFPGSEGASEPNRLVIQLQPDEGMKLHLTAKEPGPGGIRLRPVSLDLSYAQTFQRSSPDAYERLLMDVVRGNPTLFMRRDEVEAAWTWVEPILERWAPSRPLAAPLPGRHQRPERGHHAARARRPLLARMRTS